MAAPVDRVDVAEAARILSCPQEQVAVLLGTYGLTDTSSLSRVDVEAVALSRWRRRHALGPDSYWVTRPQACEILGVNRARVGQLVAAGLIPFERARTPGRQLVFRRAQLEVVARARTARWRRPRGGPVTMEDAE